MMCVFCASLCAALGEHAVIDMSASGDALQTDAEHDHGIFFKILYFVNGI